MCGWLYHDLNQDTKIFGLQQYKEIIVVSENLVQVANSPISIRLTLQRIIGQS